MKARPPPVVWLLVGGALALRVGWVLFCWTRDGPAFEFDDEELHWQLATNLVERGELVSADGRHAARMPVYPLFLAAFAGLGQTGILVARLAQALIGAATALVVCHWGQAALGKRAAIVAGLLVCCDPYGVFSANLLLTEVLFVLIGVGLTACAWRVAAQPARADRAALFGVAVLGAAAVLTRPSAAGWIPLIWLVMWICDRDRRRGALRVLGCAATMIVLMLPWGIRNRATIGAFAWLSTNGGVTLYDAQGPQADGSSNQAFLQEIPELAELDEVARDRTLQHLAIAQMKRDPARVLRLAWVKLRRTWNPVPNVAQYRGGYTAVASAVFTTLVLALAAAGLWRAAAARRTTPDAEERPTGRFHALIWLPVVYFTLVHCVYIGSLRYRVPLMPFLEMAAAAAFTQYHLRRRR